MRKAIIAILISFLVVPLVAQEVAEKPVESKTEVKEWKLLGAQVRELQRLIQQFNEQLAELIREYQKELKEVYPDMPLSVDFDFDKYSFKLPPNPEVKEKKDESKK